MATQPKMFPNQYNSLAELSGTSTGSALKFGFNATYIRLNNTSADTVYFDLTSTSPASTSDAGVLTSGQLLETPVSQCAGLGLAKITTGGGIDIMVLG